MSDVTEGRAPEPTTLPPVVSRQDWVRALASIGIPTKGLRRVESDPRHLTLTYLAEVDGKKVIVGDVVAEVAHVVALR
jgi:hypothetical protein